MSDQSTGAEIKAGAAELKKMTTVDFIREYAGKMSATEMAKHLGITVNSVTGMASKRAISLKVPFKKRGRKSAAEKHAGPCPVCAAREAVPQPFLLVKSRPVHLQEKLEDASALLRENGYTVLLPDPFKKMSATAQG